MILATLASPEAPQPPNYACDPALTALFTPRHPQLGRYEVCTTSEPLEVVSATSGSSDRPAALEALEAFGSVGSYDRWALVRLYGGTRVRVARGWTAAPDRFLSVTRLSPYPDATLTHLLPGTMEIRWTLQPWPQRPAPLQALR
jgi:hypothetical protein